ncbi:MAG: FAD-dependent oxidoreductase [Treponema sp.]|jgi:2-enoate reductase|nr:FAD-dependent oxidoreductase [Treponema sp.]
MTNPYPNLFSPIKINTVEIKNRIAMMPMGVFSKRMMNPDGSYTQDGADYYIERAKGGAGLIITGLVPMVDWLGFPHILKSPETYIESQKYLVKGIHEQGARVFIQMSAIAGRSSVHPGDPAPSVLPMVWDPTKNSREMTVDEIHQYVKNFAAGAAVAKAAGIDGVEIHAVHEGYLLDQFTIANFNRRTDEYGGSLENRLRFPMEIVKAIKEKCGADYPVSVRYSVRSYVKGFNRGALPGEEFTEFGRGLEESRKAARMLVDAGFDMLNCDNGTYDSWYWAHPPVYMPLACNLADVEEIKKAVNVPVICAGRFDNPALAESAIGEGKIDMMGMGRPLLADPYLPVKVREGKEKDIRPCISCHLGCLSRIFQPPFKDICCALNPAVGREAAYALKPAGAKKKIAVAGGGIAGMEAARVCALRGHQVDLYEKGGELGGLFNAASAFDFKDHDKRLLTWYKKQIQDLAVTVRLNTEFTPAQAKDYDEIFVAAGAKEKKLDIPGFDSPDVTYAVETLLKDNIRDKKVLIVGAGLTGCELAYALALKGCGITLVEAEPTILNVEGLNASNYNMLVELLEYHKVTILTGAVVTKYSEGVAAVTQKTRNIPNANGRAAHVSLTGLGVKIIEVPADRVVVSVGYTSDQELYEKVKGEHVYLLGDAEKPGNLMTAIWKAYETAMNV